MDTYELKRSGTCRYHIVTQDDCLKAAAQLGLPHTTVASDWQSGSADDPPFCYVEGYPVGTLKFNADGTNFGSCYREAEGEPGMSDISCLCQLSEEEGWCTAPEEIQNAADYSCSPVSVRNGRPCTPVCDSGIPSEQELMCSDNGFSPPSFSCKPKAVTVVGAGSSLIPFFLPLFAFSFTRQHVPDFNEVKMLDVCLSMFSCKTDISINIFFNCEKRLCQRLG